MDGWLKIKNKILSLNESDTLVIAVLISYLLLYLYHAFVSIIFPFQMDYGEGFTLNTVRILSNGGNIYPLITDKYFITSPYPPLYYLIYSLLVKISDISFSTGRLISVVSTLIVSYLIYLIVKIKTKRPVLGAISSLIFLLSPYTFYWSALARVDMLALLFSLLGIYFIFKYKGEKWIYLSVLFFVLSVYTKQSYFAAPIAVFLYLIIRNKQKNAMRFIVSFSLFVISLFLMLNYITDWQFYIHVIKNSASHRFSIPLIFSFYWNFLDYYIYAILIVLAMTVVTAEFIKKRFSLFGIYFIIAGIFTVIIGKIGSTINYYLELTAIISVLFGFVINKLMIDTKRNSTYMPLFLYISIISIFVAIIGYFAIVNDPTPLDVMNNQKVSSIIENTKGRILSEDAGLLVLNNRPDDVFEFFILSSLSRAGLWDQSGFVNEMKNQEFSLIILNFNITESKIPEYELERVTDEMLIQIRQNYIITDKIGSNQTLYEYYIYTPNR